MQADSQNSAPGDDIAASVSEETALPTSPDVPPQESPPLRKAMTIDEQIAAMELECRFRQIKVRQASRMRDVIQLQSLDIRGELVSRTSEIRGLKQLALGCEARLRELMGSHLVELRAQTDLATLIQLRSHFQHREWGYLKASYPLIFREADSEAERNERRLIREIELQKKRTRGS
jgi:hypothetical protein